MNISYEYRDFPVSWPARNTREKSGELIAGDEELVLDDRSERRPAEVVEDKLSDMLKGDSVMISQLRMKRLIGRRL